MRFPATGPWKDAQENNQVCKRVSYTVNRQWLHLEDSLVICSNVHSLLVFGVTKE